MFGNRGLKQTPSHFLCQWMIVNSLSEPWIDGIAFASTMRIRSRLIELLVNDTQSACDSGRLCLDVDSQSLLKICPQVILLFFSLFAVEEIGDDGTEIVHFKWLYQ